ncbi:MAG: hypothetical protein QOH90_300 [Actinomycetota bacterium]|jgi:hypothetical protein|nr:hypothetical protein [Actinomycetota bacterium]
MLLAAALAADKTGSIKFDLTLDGLLALAAGILILIFPKTLNYIVAAYLIFIGITDIFNVHF